jgi:type I restriction enzyme S subunit
MESGHTPNKKVPEYWTNCDIPWVSLNDTAYLREHDYVEDTNYRINELGLANSSARLLPSRAVVFTRDATIGLSAITTRPMAVSQHIIAWLCGPRIVPEYLLRVFYAMAQEFERLAMGSTIKTIGMPDVNELKTPVPPLDEQIAIVKYVLGNTDRIDMVLVAVLDSINLLREYRTALISAAVTGKIDVRGEET